MKNFEIRENVLVGCLNKGAVSLTIPEGVTSIGSAAFNCCSSLTSITIPNSVTSIGDYAFQNCSSLTSITIPNSVTSIEDYAFYECSSLTSVKIGNSVTWIGDWAFENCSSLTSIAIPDSVTSIGMGAFCSCSKLKNIIIGNGVQRIGNFAFCKCRRLMSQTKNYKAFNIKDGHLQCRSVLFSPTEWSNKIDNIQMCNRGYHYCTNLFDVFNYYGGDIDEDIAIYECEVGDATLSRGDGDSKHVTNKIKPVKRLYREDIIRILNGQD